MSGAEQISVTSLVLASSLVFITLFFFLLAKAKAGKRDFDKCYQSCAAIIGCRIRP